MPKRKRIKSFKQIKDIIEPIPAELFQVGAFGHNPNGVWGDIGDNKGPEDNGKSCFLGHIHRHFKPNSYLQTGNHNGYGARQLTRKFLEEVHGVNVDGSEVNNRTDINGYNQPEIKDRVMAMIEDGIKWEESKQKES